MDPSTAESLHQEVEDRLRSSATTSSLEVKYKQPEAGVRTRKDGIQVKWKLSRPIPASEASAGTDIVSASGHRKDLPFFTHDVTERDVRVPFNDETKTTHPCGAVGISTVEVVFPGARYSEYVKLYESVLGVSARSIGGSSGIQSHDFKVESPVRGSRPSRILSHSGQREVDPPGQRASIGICGLRLARTNRESQDVQALGSDGIASTLYLG